MAMQQKNLSTASADVKQTASAGKKNLLKRGSLSIVYTVVFIALIIALNLVISSIAGSVNLTIDLTSERSRATFWANCSRTTTCTRPSICLPTATSTTAPTRPPSKV